MRDLGAILKDAARIYLGVAVVSAAVGVPVGLVFGCSPSRALELLGNISILEAAVFFIVGGLKNVFHSPSTSTFRHVLGVGDGDWTIEELRDAERKGLVYIVAALALLAETGLLGFLLA